MFCYNISYTKQERVKRLNFLVTLIVMALIGALIGGFTNHLAIKMLFRPHEAKYIGKWRLPFTPGLIPKRRNELAVQLGKTVTNYLLTPETFRKKLLTPEMETKAETFLQQKIDEYVFSSDKTLNDWLTTAGAGGIADKAERKVMDLLDSQMNQVKVKLTTGTVNEVVPQKWVMEIDSRIPAMTTYILGKTEHYFASDEGRAMFHKMIDDFLASKGTLGNMVNMFFGESESLVGKIQKEALQLSAAPGTTAALNSILQNEWDKLQNRPVDELLSGFDWDGLFGSLRSYVEKELDLESRLDRTITDYWPSGASWTEENITPSLVSFAFKQAEKQMEISMEKLKIDEMVKEQVDSFPVAILEDLVLGISKREFKMITVLGAVLGGLIGIVQGFIVLVLN